MMQLLDADVLILLICRPRPVDDALSLTDGRHSSGGAKHTQFVAFTGHTEPPVRLPFGTAPSERLGHCGAAALRDAQGVSSAPDLRVAPR